MKKLFSSIIFISIIVLMWYALFLSKKVSPAILPSPLEVAVAFPAMFLPSGYLGDVVSTLSKSLLAFIISVPIGIVSGFIIFNLKFFKYPSELALDFVRSIPATALVPLFLIVFGIGDITKIAIGIFSSSLIICLSTITGLNNRNITRIAISRILQIKNLKRLLYLDLPESLGQIFLGLRAGVSLALILVVVSEMFIGSNNGIGKVINDMRYSDQTPLLYCALLMSGVIGYLFNILLIVIEKKIIHWKGQ